VDARERVVAHVGPLPAEAGRELVEIVVGIGHRCSYAAGVRNLMREQELARERFEQLYRDHARTLFAYIRWQCGDDAIAEDLLADVFERALRSAHKYDPDRGSESTWLYAIAVNRVRDHGRRRAAERRAVDRLQAEVVASVSGGPAPSDERYDVSAALAQLTPDEREVIALRYGADLTVAQVAAALGEPLTTVEGRLYRGLRGLRREMQPRTV
jgi:RNA polymerase sigma-70 factor (ECF subfamily)